MNACLTVHTLTNYNIIGDEHEHEFYFYFYNNINGISHENNITLCDECCKII
jgi:hypothetical protein